MKHLKYFESSGSESIISDLKNILSDLEDEGYSIDISDDNDAKIFYVTIIKKAFNYDDMEESIDHMINYMKLEGYDALMEWEDAMELLNRSHHTDCITYIFKKK